MSLCVSARQQREQCQDKEECKLEQRRKKRGGEPLVCASGPNSRQHRGNAGQENSGGQRQPDATETPMNVEPFQAHERDLRREEGQPCGCGQSVEERRDAHRTKRNTGLYDAAKEERGGKSAQRQRNDEQRHSAEEPPVGR
ncbi:MAG TPA: hypothetical protein VEZ41_07480 [Allosphingosinicella sp.]|nr:hypothetical protein [Allosphingosinicella sp.]